MKPRASLFLLFAYLLGTLSGYGQESIDANPYLIDGVWGLNADWDSAPIIEVKRPWGELPWEEERVPRQERGQDRGIIVPSDGGHQLPEEPGTSAPNSERNQPAPRQLPWTFGSIPYRDPDNGPWLQDDPGLEDWRPREEGSRGSPVYPDRPRSPDVWSYRDRYYDRPPIDPWAYRYKDYYGYPGYGYPDYAYRGGEPWYRYYDRPTLDPWLYRYRDYYTYPGERAWYPESRWWGGGLSGWDPWYYPDRYYYDGLMVDPWTYGPENFYGPWWADPWLLDKGVSPGYW
jgi:hypothetical protein